MPPPPFPKRTEARSCLMYHYTGLGREKQVSFPRLRRNFLFSLSWRFFPKQFSKKHLLFLAPSAKILLLYKNPIKRVPFCGAFDRRGGLGAASTPGVLLYRGCFYPAFPASKRRCRLMAKCDICGKGVTFGIKVSHSHRRSNRTWKPNVRRVKAIVDGSPRHIYACTRCLRSGKVQRAL